MPIEVKLPSNPPVVLMDAQGQPNPSKTGLYVNPHHSRLEYWFVHEGRRCKIGECMVNEKRELKEKWYKDTHRQLVEVVFKHFRKNPAMARDFCAKLAAKN